MVISTFSLGTRQELNKMTGEALGGRQAPDSNFKSARLGLPASPVIPGAMEVAEGAISRAKKARAFASSCLAAILISTYNGHVTCTIYNSPLSTVERQSVGRTLSRVSVSCECDGLTVFRSQCFDGRVGEGWHLPPL